MRAVLKAPSDAQPHRHVAGLSIALRAVLDLQAVGIEEVFCWPTAAAIPVESLREDPRVQLMVHEDFGSREKGQRDRDELVLMYDLDFVVERALLRELVQRSSPALAVGAEGTRGAAVQRAAALPSCEGLPELTLPHWTVDMRKPGAEQSLLHRLFEGCRKPVDGIVSRHLNRHLSLAISRRLVDTRISPNIMTGLTFLVAVVASALALRADYFSTAVAGVLMQLNSVLDGCDGELARVRHQGSRLGQWLDTVGDDLSNVLFWAALGYGARVLPDVGGWYCVAGVVAALANLAAALCNYAVLYRIGSGDYYALDGSGEDKESKPASAIVAALALLFKQDFFLFATMLLALAGWLHQSLPVVALGATITFLNSAIRAWRFFALQAQRSTAG